MLHAVLKEYKVLIFLFYSGSQYINIYTQTRTHIYNIYECIYIYIYIHIFGIQDDPYIFGRPIMQF